jgi:hypothetical protein
MMRRIALGEICEADAQAGIFIQVSWVYAEARVAQSLGMGISQSFAHDPSYSLPERDGKIA